MNSVDLYKFVAHFLDVLANKLNPWFITKTVGKMHGVYSIVYSNKLLFWIVSAN